MTVTAALSVIVAAFATVLGTALAARPSWSPTAKRAISGTVAIVLGLLSAIVTGRLPWVPDTVSGWLAQALTSVAMVITLAQGIHRQMAGALDSLEKATSPEGDRLAPSEGEPVLPAEPALDVPADDPGMIEPTDDTAPTDGGSGSAAAARHAQV